VHYQMIPFQHSLNPCMW